MKIQKLVLDAAPLIGQTREELLGKGEELYTSPAVFNEIKDESARARLQLLKADLHVKQPGTEAVNFVKEFAKKTGDSTVLSAPDIGIIALTYELHPNKDSLHQAPKIIQSSMKVVEHRHGDEESDSEPEQDEDGFTVVSKKSKQRKHRSKPHTPRAPPPEAEEDDEEEFDSDVSESGWITPENVDEKVQGDSADVSPVTAPVPVALSSNDFAVQNVALQIGLDVISTNGLLIKQLRTYVQRCHACFKVLPIAKNGPPRQFCPQCGGHTLTRVTASVKDGEIHLHLKANMQWRTRGDRYSIASPQSARARKERHDQKLEFYVEDQPEYQKAVKKEQWQKTRNEKVARDWIGPSTGDSAASPFAAGRQQVEHVRVGKGRYANQVKKKIV